MKWRSTFANWKTSLSGLVTAFCGFVVASPSHFSPLLVDISKYVAIGGLASFGLLAKDRDVTGGDRPNGTLK